MKASLLLFLFSGIFNISVEAHTFKAITKFKSSTVEASFRAGLELTTKLSERYESARGGIVYEAYRVSKVSPPRKPSESDLQFYQRLIKAAIHRDYPITGNDGGYGFGLVSKDKGLGPYLAESFDSSSMGDPENSLRNSFVAATDYAQRDGALVMVGDGSGNNTYAEFVTVFDPKTLEFFFILISNFGSDD